MKKLILITSLIMYVFCQNTMVFADEIIETEKKVTSITEATVSEKIEYTTEIQEIITQPIQTYIPQEYSNNAFDITTEYVGVQEIVVSEFKSELFVKETQNVSATVLPANATKSTLSYSSSNNNVATVDALGKVTAVGKGSCTISVEAGGFVHYLNLDVKIKTNEIYVDKDFITLKPNDTYSLNAKVLPEEAIQQLKYKSTDDDIISVDESGVITAKKVGSAAVIISNKDKTISVNVIVNSTSNILEENKNNEIKTDDNGDSLKLDDELAEKIKNSTEKNIVVDGEKYKVISSKSLKMLYGTDKKLIVESKGYTITLNGRDIKNVKNSLNTELIFEENENGKSIFINKDVKLPGKIKVEFIDSKNDFKYMYLYNNNKNKYEEIKSLISKNTIEVDYNGQYLLTIKKLQGIRFNFVMIFSAIMVILIMCGIYIFVKKKYWFW